MDTRELYSIEEDRFVLGGMSRATTHELHSSGELPSMVIGRRRFVRAAAIATSTRTVASSERRASGRHRSVQIPLQLEAAPPRQGRRRVAVPR